MNYLIDNLPNFCPDCGKAHSNEWAAANASDFSAGASLSCTCGAMFQFMPVVQLIKASRLNPSGDLYRYAEPHTLTPGG